MRSATLALLVGLIVCPAAAFAVQPNEMLADPALEARARALSSELRCLVCQNQSIDDSDADLARDIRLLIRDRIAKGERNDQVRDYLVQRYGDFILLKPPLNEGDPFAVAQRAAVSRLGRSCDRRRRPSSGRRSGGPQRRRRRAAEGDRIKRYKYVKIAV